MVNPDIRIKYDGGDANYGSIDMRQLGRSLQGADKIISDGLIVLIHNRPPRRGERAPVSAKVREPVEGSYELWALYEAVRGLLQLGIPSSTDLAGHFIGKWWEAVIAKFSGKSDIAEKAIDALLQTQREFLAAKNSSEERTQELLMAQQMTIRETLAMQARAIEQFVTPIGASVDQAEIYPAGAPTRLLTTADAEAIRESMKVEWQSIDEMVLRTDGFRFHTSALSVENPERDGFLMARVHDPKFRDEENVYTEAAQRRSAIAVLARKGYRGDELAAIEILEFRHEIPS